MALKILNLIKLVKLFQIITIFEIFYNNIKYFIFILIFNFTH